VWPGESKGFRGEVKVEMDLEDLDPSVLRRTVFLDAYRLEGGAPVFVADYGLPGSPYRWLVLDTSMTICKVHLYTTEEVKILYKSYRDERGAPIQANPTHVYRFLVGAGVYRMKVRNGCTGCRRFWNAPGSEGQCGRCKRCLNCCSRIDVPYSCVAKELISDRVKRR
jgi:hypothetical protein